MAGDSLIPSIGQSFPLMRQIFYGWYLTGAIFIVVMAASGLGFYTMPILLSALVEEYNLPLTGTSYGVSLFFLASALVSPIVGWALDRFDIRWVMCGGGVASALLLAFIGQASTLPRLYLFFALFGITYAFCSLAPAATLIGRWFSNHRARAMTIAHTGLSLGGVLLSPLVAFYLNQTSVADTGYMLALLFLALTIIPTILIIRPDPAYMGLEIDGNYRPPDAPLPRIRGTPYRLAATSHLFVYSTLAWIFAMAAQNGSILHFYNFAATAFDAQTAGLTITFVAASSLMGRFIGGWVMERMTPHNFALILFLTQGTALILISQTTASWQFLLCVMLFGLTVGNIFMTQPLLLAAAFGPRHFGNIQALGQAFNIFGSAVGPAVVAIFLLIGGDYFTAYAMSGTLLSSLAFLLLAIVRPRMRMRF